MQLASGVDLIEICRVRKALDRHGERFLSRVFTPLELEDLGPEPAAKAASLAARFAAKEAVAKALGTGIGQIGWLEIEIRRGPAGEPRLYLYGEAARLAQARGLQHWSVSLSHTAEHAVAFVVAAGTDSA